MNQSEKATHFHRLHDRNTPLVLFNSWDVASSRAVEKGGASAIATGSHSVAAAHGFDDGEKISLDKVLWIAERICTSTDLPVSIDFEGAYAPDPKGVAENVTRLIQTGAVGMNFEDGRVSSDGLYAIEDQAARIRQARKAADLLQIPFFINARTDLFLNAENAEHGRYLDEAVERANAYIDAGADGIFVPGLIDEPLVRKIVHAVDAPINVMLRGMEQLKTALDWPVSRISFGPFPHAWTMDWLAGVAGGVRR